MGLPPLITAYWGVPLGLGVHYGHSHAGSRSCPTHSRTFSSVQSSRHFSAQVSTIKEALDIDLSLPIAPALHQANQMLGLRGEGRSLPSQATAILEQLGL